MTTKVLAFVGPTHNASGEESVNHSQHVGAIAGRSNPFGRALRKMLEGWEEYAAAHQSRYESGIGQDGVLGDYWAEVGLSIKRLLDGDTGGFDCGSIAHNIVEQINAQGIPNDGYRLDR